MIQPTKRKQENNKKSKNSIIPQPSLAHPKAALITTIKFFYQLWLTIKTLSKKKNSTSQRKK